MFVTEALHPFNVFRQAGFEVDLVSETGSYSADWLSQTKDWLPEKDRKVWEDKNSEFRKALDRGLKPSDLKASDVRTFCAPIEDSRLQGKNFRLTSTLDYSTACSSPRLAMPL